MKNWRTTLAGGALAFVAAVQGFQANGGDLKDWKVWLISGLIAFLGYIAKDTQPPTPSTP